MTKRRRGRKFPEYPPPELAKSVLLNEIWNRTNPITTTLEVTKGVIEKYWTETGCEAYAAVSSFEGYEEWLVAATKDLVAITGCLEHYCDNPYFYRWGGKRPDGYCGKDPEG